MLGHVAKRLLQDPKSGGARRISQLFLIDFRVESRRDPRLSLKLSSLALDCGDQAKIVQNAWAQLARDLARRLDQSVERMDRGCQVRSRWPGLAIDQVPLARARPPSLRLSAPARFRHRYRLPAACAHLRPPPADRAIDDVVDPAMRRVAHLPRQAPWCGTRRVPRVPRSSFGARDHALGSASAISSTVRPSSPSSPSVSVMRVRADRLPLCNSRVVSITRRALRPIIHSVMP